MGVKPAGSEVRIGQDSPVQRYRRLDAFDDKHFQSALHAANGFGAVATLYDQLGDHRIVVRRNYCVGIGRRIHANSGAARRLKSCDASGGRHKCFRIFGIDTALDSVSAEMNFAHSVVQLFAGRDANLGFDQVRASDKLGDRVLDLDARIHFDKINRAVLIQQKLDRASVGVANSLQCLDDPSAHFFAQLGVQHRRRRFFDQFLMAALDGTFALAQMNDFAVLIAQNLKFNVSRIFNEALGVNVGRAKGLLRLAARRFVRGQKFFLLAHHAHAATAAAGNRLHNQREAYFRGFFGQLFFALDRAIAPWNRWQTRAFHFTARAILFAHHFNYFRSRANKRNFRGFADFGEICVFGEKSVTRVNGVNIGDLGSADYVRDIQITFAAAGWADTNRFIGKPHMQRIAVRLRVHGNRGDSQLLAGTNHPQGNFAAIGYQNFFEHISRRLLLAARTDSKQWLAVLDRLPVLHENPQHFPAAVGLNLIHQFHSLNDAQRFTVFDISANLYKRLGAGARRSIKRTDDR